MRKKTAHRASRSKAGIVGSTGSRGVDWGAQSGGLGTLGMVRAVRARGAKPCERDMGFHKNYSPSRDSARLNKGLGSIGIQASIFRSRKALI
jgi:hypothetical protein